MHSSTLRDSDFEIIADGHPIEPAGYFRGFTNTKRLGLLAPNRYEGTGAITLVMAHVTAFYNTYRGSGSDFFAYPDYFTFQSTEPIAAYGMFDIWPDHKSVLVEQDPITRLNAITDRAINILLVPDGDPASQEYQRQQLASAERLIDTCYAYSPNGVVADPDLTICCKTEPFAAWSQSVFESIPDGQTAPATDEIIEQSFRRISLGEALALL